MYTILTIYYISYFKGFNFIPTIITLQFVYITIMNAIPYLILVVY